MGDRKRTKMNEEIQIIEKNEDGDQKIEPTFDPSAIPLEAEEAKRLGNEAYKTGRFVDAIEFYSKAISIKPDWHLPYSNRAMAEAKMKKWDDVLFDAKKCIELSPPNFLKGHYWLGKALVEKEAYDEAMKNLAGKLEKLSLEQGQELRALLKEASNSKHLSGGSVATDPRKLSMKEFDIVEELGEGNFTTVLHVRHKVTKENFALKCIDKANAKRISRRHPNIYNEINMERRVLVKFIGTPNIVNLYHTFQDPYSLYYLMELCQGGEVWKSITENGLLVGCYPSLAKFYLAEVVSALEFIHSQGIVHRDLKPENMMLTLNGHLKLIDFGTAKDLINEDLNGPDFVGTPEFMSPQAVLSQPCGRETDIWSLGCCAFQFLCGPTPFKAPSPFLSFTRIKMKTHMVAYPKVLPFDAKDLIQNLLKYEPQDRLGAGETGMQALKKHPFFEGVEFDNIGLQPAIKIPKLKELCIRPIGSRAVALASDFDIDVALEAKRMLATISADDRLKVMHYLDRKNELKNPRCLRLFHENVIQARCLKACPYTREYLGFNYQNEGQWGNPFFFIHVGDPQLGISVYDEGGGSSWEVEAENLRRAVKAINKLRPKFVVFSGDMTNAFPGDKYFEQQLQDFQSIVSKISDSIPILFLPGNHDVGDFPTTATIEQYTQRLGADYYCFWFGGVLNIVLNSSLMMIAEDSSKEEKQKLEDMKNWLHEQIETNKYSAQHIMIFLHHPIYVTSIDEPDQYIDKLLPLVQKELVWSVPHRNRQRLLDLLAEPVVKCIFSGHLHRNNKVVYKGKPKCSSSPKQDAKTKTSDAMEEKDSMNLSAGESPDITSEAAKQNADQSSELSSEDTDNDDDNGEDDPDVNIRMITTNSVGMSLNPDELCGIRIVKVYEYEIVDDYYSLDEIPSKVTLEVK